MSTNPFEMDITDLGMTDMAMTDDEFNRLMPAAEGGEHSTEDLMQDDSSFPNPQAALPAQPVSVLGGLKRDAVMFMPKDLNNKIAMQAKPMDFSTESKKQAEEMSLKDEAEYIELVDLEAVYDDISSLFNNNLEGCFSINNSGRETWCKFSEMHDRTFKKAVDFTFEDTDLSSVTEIYFGFYEEIYEKKILILFERLCQVIKNNPKVIALKFEGELLNNHSFFKRILLHLIQVLPETQLRILSIQENLKTGPSFTAEFDQAFYKTLSSCLAANTSLTELDLANLNFNKVGRNELAYWLNNSNTLRTLEITGLDSQGLKILSNSLKRKYQLQALAISVVGVLQTQALEALGGLIKFNIGLKKFVLMHSDFSQVQDQNSPSFCQAFKHNKGLIDLCINNVKFRDQDFELLCEAIDPSSNSQLSQQLQSFSFVGYDADAEHSLWKDKAILFRMLCKNVAMLCAALQDSQSLTTLELSDNWTDDWKVVGENNYSSEITKDDCKIFEEFTQTLKESLARHKSLTKLDLSCNVFPNNSFTINFFSRLGDIISSSNCRLNELTLSNMRQGMQATKILFESLARNTSIHSLNFDGNHIGYLNEDPEDDDDNDSELSMIAKFLGRNRFIKFLNLDGEFSIPPSSVFELIDSLKSTPYQSLTSLSLSGIVGKNRDIPNQDKDKILLGLEECLLAMLNDNSSVCKVNFDEVDSDNWELAQPVPYVSEVEERTKISGRFLDTEKLSDLLDLQKEVAGLKGDTTWDRKAAAEKLRLTTRMLQVNICLLQRSILHVQIAEALLMNTPGYLPGLQAVLQSCVGSRKNYDAKVVNIICQYVSCKVTSTCFGYPKTRKENKGEQETLAIGLVRKRKRFVFGELDVDYEEIEEDINELEVSGEENGLVHMTDDASHSHSSHSNSQFSLIHRPQPRPILFFKRRLPREEEVEPTLPRGAEQPEQLEHLEQPPMETDSGYDHNDYGVNEPAFKKRKLDIKP